jgi:predicted permease
MGPLEQGVEFFTVAQYRPPPRKGPFLYTVIARLRDNTTRSAAAEELKAINRRIFPVWRASYQDEKATWTMMSLKEYVTGEVGTIAGVALGAVALVWLIACANASSLLVARVTSRRRELAVRAALGASRGRVVRLVLAESLLLACGAAAGGVALAWAGVRLLPGVAADYFPRTHEIALDGTVLAVLATVTLASALLFGLVPAAHGSGGAMDESLRASTRSATGTLGVRRLRRVLVGGQFAIATPLLVVAGLLLVTLDRLGRVDLGFDGRNILTGSIQLPERQYEDPARVSAFWDEMKRRVEAVPGVSSVAFADGLPPDNVNDFNNFDLEDHPTPAGQSQPVTPWVGITPEYVRVLGLTVIEGRLLDERDARAPNLEAIMVDRAWANRFFPGQPVLGRRLREGGCTTCQWTTVVGVVNEVKYAGLDQPDEGSVYRPLGPGTRFRYVVVKTSVRPASLVPAVRNVVRDLDASVPFTNAATIAELVDGSLQQPRSLSWLVTSFAVVALTLSIVGIYGVMAYYVQQHAKDISIRMALGGTSRDVLRLILGQGMRVVASGVAIGLLFAVTAARLVSSLLFGVAPGDLRTLIAVGVLLHAAALVACMLPARSAVSVEPAAVLRQE